MITKNKTLSYQQFVSCYSDKLIEDLTGIAITGDVLTKINKKTAEEFVKECSKHRISSWLDLRETNVDGDDIIQSINSEELNKYILNVLNLDFVNCIYEFYSDGNYELWVIVNQYNSTVCKNIYKDSFVLDNVNIIVAESNQIDYDEMPKPNFIFNKSESKR